MGKPLVDLTGKQIGYWAVLERAKNKGNHAQWLCRCKCGNERVVIGIVLRDERSRSCGCLHRQACIDRSTKHGAANRGKTTRTYQAWSSMMKRCNNPKALDFGYYGGRGIKVCERWREYENFLFDMGEKPEGLSLGRIDNDGNYEPSNCRWETGTQQGRNKRNNRYLEFNGERLTVLEWSERLNIPYNRLMNRLWRGWSADKTLSG